ncbi:hypothetical protein Mal64_22170 [Pseudobythopirellula maris]|uniref:Uncharacterized protein n=1 Tax=Pseudobythopirellula maris TaxID=2527991 RepID=A0A5C5ZMS5_9BACT|nr:hypothetical protein [Pseudobythopirellula maris]TWT88729.1 hypothetical protein Mal64_22170 [Pseudobythopirellula maris]
MQETIRWRRAIGRGLVGFGLLAVVVGLGWSRFIPDEVFWSTTDAEAYNAAQADQHAAHSSSHDHEAMGPGSEEHESEPYKTEDHGADLAAAERFFEQAQQRLGRARFARNHLGRVIAVGGALMMVLGAFWLRSAGDGA